MKPEALIIQDLAMIELARQAGYKGELHLSTLSNVTHPAALEIAKKMGASRIVVPRELNLDEVKMMSEACPKGLDLEIFVHGALCNCISGRCYWSSFLGGKSGLRGRCVQPCRRLYRQGKADPQRLFSCMDLSLDVLTKPLLSLPGVNAWKVEGRKKGPHYVYYTISAYRMLRDNPNDAQAKKTAQELLDMALGRPSSHSLFLPQRPFMPIQPGGETSSGRLIGQIKRDGQKLYFETREALFPGDLVRVGYEDQPGHRTLSVRRRIPKRGRFDLPVRKQEKSGYLPSRTKVFLVDRREPELTKAIRDLEARLAANEAPASPESSFEPTRPKPFKPFRTKSHDVNLFRESPTGRIFGRQALWLDHKTLQSVPRASKGRTQWWLPPVIWPDEEKHIRSLIRDAVRNGANEFVCNAPWQVAFFTDRKNMTLIAGPYCNASNHYALDQLRKLGFSSAYAAPELPAEDALALAHGSPLPLGFVLKGLWPFGISRFLAEEVRLEDPIRSPMNEVCWVKKIGQNNWIFPGWEVDLSSERRALEKAGYKFFLSIRERWPKGFPRATRTSRFNWDLKLL